MKPDPRPFLGQLVHVVVDRPLGRAHPRFPELVYPVNYSEIPGTLSGDGCPVDVYLVGWGEPCSGATARVVAAVLRADDREDKLIAVPDGSNWTGHPLWAAVRFQEQFFRSTLIFGATLTADE